MDDKELVADMRETVRYWEHIYPRDKWGAYQRAHEQAADRIEALTAQLTEAKAEVAHLAGSRLQMEAEFSEAKAKAEALAEAARLFLEWQPSESPIWEEREWDEAQQGLRAELKAWEK